MQDVHDATFTGCTEAQASMTIDEHVKEIEISLATARLIKVWSDDRGGEKQVWHLKVMNKGNLVLL